MMNKIFNATDLFLYYQKTSEVFRCFQWVLEETSAEAATRGVLLKKVFLGLQLYFVEFFIEHLWTNAST